ANETLDLGGGMWSLGDPRLTGCRFLGNLATAHNFQGMGAALYSNGNPVIQDCLFRDNRANSSGGAVFSIGSPTVDDCRLESNFGGAGGAFSAQGNAVFTNCLFAGNVAVNDIFENSGGAVSCDGSPSFFNCTFTACAAADKGGGIYVFAGNTLLTNNIFWGNSDRSGSGESAQIFLETGTTTQLNFCCVEGLTGVLGGVGNMNEDPRFADELGGDFHLRAVSPCIASGNGLLSGIPKLDFEGDSRFPALGTDIGFDEFARHLYVLGDFTPGGAVTIKIVGDPGSSPVVLSVGLGLKEVPDSTPSGNFFLENLVKEKGLPPVPPSGILVVPATLPPVPPASGIFALQALVGDKLTNPWRIDVE
ncbi:MAG: right-handed parallel beta-helix repeat-containing protein, partial [Planctomycetota bacterium]